MVEIPGPDRVRVKLDAAEIDDPGQARGVVDHDLVGGPAGGNESVTVRSQSGGLRGRASGRRLALGPVDEALEHDRAVADRRAARRAPRRGSSRRCRAW